MLCQQCQTNQATRHVCKVDGEASKTLNLCVECFKLLPEGRALEAQNEEAKKRRCQCCGKKAEFGMTNFLTLLRGKVETIYVCHPCAMRFNRRVALALRRIPKNLSGEQHMRELERIEAKVGRLLPPRKAK